MREIKRHPALVQALAGLTDKYGRHYWRSLEELAALPAFQAYLEDEFPTAVRQGTAFNRREFLTLMGASLALAGLAGCNYQPQEQIVPYVHQPEGLVNGIPLHFASALPLGGYGHGIVVRQNEGRPTKVDGNPKHPSSLGGSNVWLQASVLELYDPDRSKVPAQGGQAASWSAFLDDWDRLLQNAGGPGQARIAILTGTVTSPALRAEMEAFRRTFPQTRWHCYEPLNHDQLYAGAKLAFGRPVHPVYDFLRARRIVALDANFLQDGPGAVRYAREFVQQRRVRFKEMGPPAARAATPLPQPAVPSPDDMNRLYVIESTFTITGAMADHRLAVPARHVAPLAAALAALVEGRPPTGLSAEQERYLRATADDLRAHRGAGLVLAGDLQPPEVHALAHAMNQALGNVGTTVRYVEPIEAVPGGQLAWLHELVNAMQHGTIDVLLILDANPVFTAPADLNFREALRAFSRAKTPAGGCRRTAIHHGLYDDETAFFCRWHLPLTHPLEMWGDVRGHDGTAALIQPLIAPLYSGRSHLELLAHLRGARQRSGREILQDYWTAQWRAANPQADTNGLWTTALRDGVVPDTASPTVQVQLAASAGQIAAAIPPPANPGIEVNFRADPCIRDGRFANNGWLQETPKPISRLTWDNVALVSPATAVKLGLPPINRPPRPEGPMLRIANAGRTMDIPAWVMLGQPDDAITIYLGYGRYRAGHVGNGTGFNAYALRTTTSMAAFVASEIRPTGKTYPLANVQHQQLMYGRDIVREREIAEFLQSPGTPPTPDLYSTATENGKSVHLSLYDEHAYKGYKWGMVIDQTACIGCNACVVSCVAENNSPVVGKTEVTRGRAMHWLRLDTYYASQGALVHDAPLPEAHVMFQPMLCQHCQNAPCELVCPVEATTHSAEGINEMTYNRCVGTRYCSNNCPYKVRRFNFFNYNDYHAETYKLMRNPEVTVRMRGVMEKCTYCVQRVNRARENAQIARLQAEENGGPLEMRRPAFDGHTMPDELPAVDVLTACQQACPTEAIIFGDLNDADSYVSKLKTREPYNRLNYGVLTELTTHPRTSYLERLLNPNPALTSI